MKKIKEAIKEAMAACDKEQYELLQSGHNPEYIAREILKIKEIKEELVSTLENHFN